MSVATEQVLVVRRDDMFPDGAWHGFVTENLERHQRVIRERHTFKPRAEADNGQSRPTGLHISQKPPPPHTYWGPRALGVGCSEGDGGAASLS